MKVRLLIDLPTPDGIVQSGRVVNIPDHIVGRLHGKVEVLPRHPQGLPTGWRPTPRAWLQDGELRTTGVFLSLASEIVKLTTHDLPLRRRLLETHSGIRAGPFVDTREEVERASGHS